MNLETLGISSSDGWLQFVSLFFNISQTSGKSFRLFPAVGLFLSQLVADRQRGYRTRGAR